MRKSWILVVCCAICGLTSGLGAMDAPNQTRGFLPATGFQTSRFDHVNLFNGALTLTLPLGQRYAVGGGLTYGLQLVYNSNIWTYESRWEGGEYITTASADRTANAGLGWLLSLGELIDGQGSDSGRWVFISADLARHTFYSSLHNGEDDEDPDVFYSRDGSYLRMSKVNGGSTKKLVEFPDGRQMTFRKSSGKWRLTRIEDRFGNFLTVSIETVDDDQTWTLTDSQGRIHYLELTEMRWIGKQVTRVDLEAFDGTRAHYDFSYAEILVNRSCKDTDPETDSRIRLPHLVRIDLPDGSYYEMKDGPDPNYYNNCAGGLEDVPGVLKGMRLPTGGGIEWTFAQHDYPPKQTAFDSSVGVAERTLLDSQGVEIGTWTYLRRNFTGPDNEKELRTHVVSPTGECSKHYFAQQYWLDKVGKTGWEYGLPFSLSENDGSGLALSTELFPSSKVDGSCSGARLRSSYLSFAHDKLPGAGGEENRPRWFDTNRRVEAGKTIYHDDGERYVEARFSDFDGYGHYRATTTGGTFWDDSTHGEERVTTTHYNLTEDSYRYDDKGGQPIPDGGWEGVIPITEPWVLGVYDYREVSEADAFGESTARVETTFDRATGFLECRRILASGTDRGPGDVLVVYTPDATGNRARVERFGGDLQGLDPAAGCAVGDTPETTSERTWAFGSLSRVQSLDGDGAPLPFLSWDAEIDAGTGFVKTSRGRGGLATDFVYDAMGRLIEVAPEEGARTVYTYTAATASQPAAVNVASLARAGGATLAESEIILDDLGRISRRRQLQPGNGWVETEAVYDALDRLLSVSLPGYPDKKTEYLGYDALGRPATIRPPEGSVHDVRLTYFGDRAVVSTTSIATSDDAEEWVPRERHLDVYGRLRKVVESSGADGGEVPTTYSYDVGHRLTRIFTDLPDSDLDQSRYYSYDNRGFLFSEQHPEKGEGGNGAVFYLDYNSGGQVGRMQDGPRELTFSYDAANRLTTVRNALAGDRVVKEYLYDSAVGRGNGRLWKAIRHNWIDLPWSDGGEEDVTVTEELNYSGLGGRVSDRLTDISLNGYSFLQSFTYDDLGQVARVDYPLCLHVDCPADTPMLSLDSKRDLGFLTRVGNLTGTIAYHPSGMVSEVPHANGVSDRTDVDPDNPGRPERIYSTGAGGGGDWNSGILAFDGNGNIKRQFDSLPIVYDRVNRLVRMDSPQARSQGYTYDTFGNITSITTRVGGVSETRSAAVVSTTNRLSAASYDAAGNMTSWAGGGTYAYDELSRLEHQNDGEWTYIYTAAGERTVAIHYTGSVDTRRETYTLRDLSARVLREWELTGESEPGKLTWLHDYSYRGSQLLAKFDAVEGATHFHPNHLGTPILQTDSAGDRRRFHWYHAYGEEATDPTQDGESIRFTGHQMDPHGVSTTDDLYYMRARYYSPHLARFLRPDDHRGSSQLPQSFNRYAYVGGRPSVMTDPDGRIAVPAAILAISAYEWITAGVVTFGGIVVTVGNDIEDPQLGGAIGLLGDSMVFAGGVASFNPFGFAAAGGAIYDATVNVERIIEGRQRNDSKDDSAGLDASDSPDEGTPETDDEDPYGPMREGPNPGIPIPEPAADPPYVERGSGPPGGPHIFHLPIDTVEDDWWNGSKYWIDGFWCPLCELESNG